MTLNVSQVVGFSVFTFAFGATAIVCFVCLYLHALHILMPCHANQITLA